MTDEVFRLTGNAGEPALLVRHKRGTGQPILYVHGATFPSALSIAYRFASYSWMDDLHRQGFDVWAFDFAGFGGSDRYAPLDDHIDAELPGRAPESARQIARVVEWICESACHGSVSVIAHSWGSIPTGLYMTQYPDRVDKLCLFGPIAQREPRSASPRCTAPSWRLITIADQLARFRNDVPGGYSPVLIEPHLSQWGPTYLATDPDAQSRTPPAVKIPAGPAADIDAAWSGQLRYRPQNIRAPTLVVRGEWDSVCNDADAAWLLSRLSHPSCRDVKIKSGTHLMHLERCREDLFTAVDRFLLNAS